jgi:hypothetical protein
MKRFLLLTVAFSIAYPAITQDDSTRLVASTRPGADKTVTDTRVTLGEDSLKNILLYEVTTDGRKLRIGNRGIEVLEGLEGRGTRMSLKKYDVEDDRDYLSEAFPQDEKSKPKVPSRRWFKGHWAGLEIGFNNYLTAEQSMVLPAEDDFMTLNSGKSKSVNINFAQINMGLTRRVGLVSGLGFHMNNYFFEGNNSLTKSAGGMIEPLYPAEGIIFDKSKITTRYITLPLMLEVQIPVNYSKRLNIAGGGIGALKLGSHTKTVYYNNGKQKVKDQGDFSLNMLRYGLTARVGYEMVQLYGTYYMTPLFKTGRGPELYPFEIGVSFTIND